MKKILSFGLLMLLLASCGAKPEETKAKEDIAEVVEEKVKQVRVMTLEKTTIDIQQEYTAAINAYDIAYVTSTMPGRIDKINVEVGDQVKRGDALVKMDDTNLAKLKLSYLNSEVNKLRGDTLVKTASMSQQNYEMLVLQYEVNKLDYKNMKENMVLKAPFNGIVTARYFEDHDVYSGAPNTQAGKASIVTVEQIEKLKVVVGVASRYFPEVKKGLEATLSTDIYPDTTFSGTVSLVAPTIDPMTRTFQSEITVSNKSLVLRPGMYAKVKLKLGEKEALVLPASAVLMQEGTSNRYIYIEKNGKAQKVNVSIGERYDDMLEIISENNLEGESIIIAGQSKLENGDKVNVN